MIKFFTFIFLLLPFLSIAQVNDTIIDGKPFVIHKVEFRETLYGISREYNAELNDIVVNNPFVINGLKIGQRLFIPVRKSFIKNFTSKVKEKVGLTPKIEKEEIKIQNTIQVVSDLNNNSKLGSVDSLFISKSDSLSYSESDSVLNISLLLPFYLDLNDSLSFDSESSIYSKSKIALDYYFGALIALETLSKIGININFNTYDIPNDSIFEDLLLKNTFDESDVIIGPLYISQFNSLAEFYQNDSKKRLVSPLSFKNTDQKYQNTFQLVPSSKIQIEKSIDYINRNYEFSNLVVIGLESEIEKINNVTSEIKLKRIQKNILPKPKVLMFKEGVMPNKESIKPFLSLDNIVIIPSNNRSFISRVLPILSSMQDSIFTVYGLSTWSMFENIDIENLNYLNTVLPDLDFQKNNELYSDFINTYFQKYYSYPSKYSCEGFKQLLYFCSKRFNSLYDFSKLENKGNFVNSKFSLSQYQSYKKVILK